ncbi:TIM barrel protein [Commensalibacter oyaizuii]|uniref:TIM barrel protein n=1 Tax=Commensalibacter oyaizuii TaxID=3043873 RepID=A0ABT6Q067_9PROT|nr:TIM barrel protein [Commensalibacter sp. TBRC 16381]MDI2090514.1 TIM barrel protein [Commensalibacter sp. TBRC 16381]
MAIDKKRFCLNRKIAPMLDIPTFFKLVHEIGLNKVELRNDMPSGKVTDSLTHQQVKELANSYDIQIITINAIYPFNRYDDQVRNLTLSMLKEAQALDINAVILCPLNEGVSIPQDKIIYALQELGELFKQYGIAGLVEPLGFPESSLRSAFQAQELIKQANVPFKLVVDTFHQYLYPDSKQDMQKLDVNSIGLVHLSGVKADCTVQHLQDEQRVMLSQGEKLNSCEQVKILEAKGYQGIYAFEPFSSELNHWDYEDIKREVTQSIQMLQSYCA